jgi:hypothetical protein
MGLLLRKPEALRILLRRVWLRKWPDSSENLSGNDAPRRLQSEKSRNIYCYSTLTVPFNTGFRIIAGIGGLACDVVGMTLDYSGHQDDW